MANEMRDRLVESMAKRFKELYKDGDWNFNEMLVGVADYLLDDGWIRPPCKVGDTVYCIFRNRETLEWYIAERTVYDIAIYKDCMHTYISPIISYCQFDFGVRIFLTKAEAEQKLKEIRGGTDGNV